MKKNAIEVLGLGAPIVDHIIYVSDEFLKNIPGTKGGMVPIDYKTMEKILQTTTSGKMNVPGGSGANTIRGIAHLGHKCALVGKIGQDLAGKKFTESLQAVGIKPYLIQTTTPTAQVACLITPDGERTMRTFLGATQEMSASDLKPEFFNGDKLVHIEGYSLLNGNLTETTMKMAKDAGSKISYDLGSFEVVEAHKERIVNLISKYVDILIGNEKEMKALTGEAPEKACAILRDLCDTVVALMGPEGSTVGRGQEQIHCSAIPVKVVDTTGAGDLYISGFLHGYLIGASISDCARFGTIVSSHVVQTQGVEMSPATWAQINSEIHLER